MAAGPRQDFLIAPAPAEAFNVVTNPPFRLARAFVERALTLGAVKIAIIFPTARLNAARWLKPLPLAKIYLLTPRPSMPPGEVIARGEKPGGGKTDFCWLVFDRTHSGPPKCGGCTEMSRDHAEPPPAAENNKRPETLLEHAPDQSEGVTTSA